MITKKTNKLLKGNPMTKLFLVCILMLSAFFVIAQDSTVVRIARLQIDRNQLQQYKAILKEEIEATVRLEPNVYSLYAVADKNDSARITVFEVYANDAAYRSHIQTPHFLKYKTSTKDMVKSLDLSEHQPILLGTSK